MHHHTWCCMYPFPWGYWTDNSQMLTSTHPTIQRLRKQIQVGSLRKNRAKRNSNQILHDRFSPRHRCFSWREKCSSRHKALFSLIETVWVEEQIRLHSFRPPPCSVRTVWVSLEKSIILSWLSIERLRRWSRFYWVTRRTTCLIFTMFSEWVLVYWVAKE